MKYQGCDRNDCRDRFACARFRLKAEMRKGSIETDQTGKAYCGSFLSTAVFQPSSLKSKDTAAIKDRMKTKSVIS